MAKSDEPNKVIYSMIGVSKRYDQKVILKDIYLSYFYGREDWRFRIEWRRGKARCLKSCRGGYEFRWEDFAAAGIYRRISGAGAEAGS